MHILIEQGMHILKSRGIFNFIVPNKWMRSNYGTPLREWLQQYQIESIIDFGDLPVFAEATTYSCLLTVSKKKTSKLFEAVEINEPNFEDLAIYLDQKTFKVDQTKLNDSSWNLIPLNQSKNYLIRFRVNHFH